MTMSLPAPPAACGVRGGLLSTQVFATYSHKGYQVVCGHELMSSPEAAPVFAFHMERESADLLSLGQYRCQDRCIQSKAWQAH